MVSDVPLRTCPVTMLEIPVSDEFFECERSSPVDNAASMGTWYIGRNIYNMQNPLFFPMIQWYLKFMPN